MKEPNRWFPSNARGVTLIELMVVVAIVAILAALGGMSYVKYLNKGRISQLKQYALEVRKGQDQFSSRNGRYLDPGSVSSMPEVYSKGNADWEELLEFKHEQMAPDVRVMTDGGVGGGCDICKSDVPGPTTTDASSGEKLSWYAVKVCKSLQGTGSGVDCSNDTTVYLDNQLEKPIVLREGQ